MTDNGAVSFPFSDLALSRRLEMAEARFNAEFVETRAGIFPESGACWIEVAGAYAMYDGATSPLTQTFGLGLFQPVTGAEMKTIEEFYRSSGAPVFHEVSPLADTTSLALLNERGYQPVEFTNVLIRPIQRNPLPAAIRNRQIRVRLANNHEQEIWAQTSVDGWNANSEFTAVLLELMMIGAKRPGALSFLAELEEKPIATGMLSICDGVALLAGASTIPERRKLGAQMALLEVRLQYAAERGCDIAMMCALPGSSSQRNAERHGFRIAYTRIKWRLP